MRGREAEGGIRRYGRGILILLFVLSLPMVTTRIYASDEVEGFSWLHSLAFDHDVSFQNEYEYFYNSGQVKNSGFHQTFLENETRAGHRPNFTTMGSALLWAPFYGVAHAVTRVRGRVADGLSRPYITAVAIGSATYGFLALLLSIGIARRIVGDGAGPAAAVWFGTPLLFYMYVTPVFAHACSAFAVALFLWVWFRVRDNWTIGGALALGLAGGLMTIVRAQDAFFIAGPALDFLRTAIRPQASATRPQDVSRRNSSAQEGARVLRPAAWGLGPAIAGACGFALIYLPQVLAFEALNGRAWQSEYETRKMTWTSPHAMQVLFDTEHGLFFWTPLAALSVAGLAVLAWRARAVHTDARWIGRLALVMFALQAYIAGAVESWTVAGAFGQRRFVSLTPLIVLGLSALWAVVSTSGRAMRICVAALFVLSVWWNLGLMAQFGLHTMDRERLTLGTNAWQSYVQLPRAAPSLIWRYVTDRSSFYNQPRQ